jgi:SAM-dependent methyltransferase
LSAVSQADSTWAVRLFNRSVLKQAKFRKILQLLVDPTGKTNLDIGGDNGVISYLLRARGGRWCSADLDLNTVDAIRDLVATEVYHMDGSRAPFPDATFDQIVIVDFLEHIPDDRGFVRELARISKPGSTLIVNVPHLKPKSLLNHFRHRIGLTDAWHGHLRPGYDLPALTDLLQPYFEIEQATTYSGTFSELVDTAMNGLYEALRRRRPGGPTSRKGTVVTRHDLEKHKKQFLLLSVVYPALWTTAKLDLLLPLQQGYKLIVRARAKSAG